MLANQTQCNNRVFATQGYHSAMAKEGHTVRSGQGAQLHNEFIVYEDCACYPEFALTYELV